MYIVLCCGRNQKRGTENKQKNKKENGKYGKAEMLLFYHHYILYLHIVYFSRYGRKKKGKRKNNKSDYQDKGVNLEKQEERKKKKIKIGKSDNQNKGQEQSK